MFELIIYLCIFCSYFECITADPISVKSKPNTNETTIVDKIVRVNNLIYKDQVIINEHVTYYRMNIPLLIQTGSLGDFRSIVKDRRKRHVGSPPIKNDSV